MNDAIPLDGATLALRSGWLDNCEAHVPVVALPEPEPADTMELVGLYNTVKEATGPRTHGIVQFVSATANERNVEAAYNFAWVGAALLGKRILFVDASAGKSGWQPAAVANPHATPRKFLADVALGHAVAEEAMARQAGLGLFIATLQHERAGSTMVAAKHMTALLEGLRSDFDMIVIAPAPALESPMAAILTTLVDGSVIVMEAGRARGRAVARCAALLSSGDSPVIGAVMQGTRNHTPRWLRRWL